MAKIDRYHERTTPLQDLCEHLLQLCDKGYEFFAFGPASENQTFPVRFWDLYKQPFWLVSKPQDSGVKHNAYDEVLFLFRQVA